MHVTYLRCKSYYESMVHVRYLRVLQDRSTENYRPVSSYSIHCRDPPRKRRYDRGRFVGGGGSSSWLGLHGGQVWSQLLLRVDFVHRTYIKPGSLKPDLSWRPRGYAEMRADRPTCGATRVQRCDLWILSLFRIIWHGDASPCNALTSRERRDNIVLRWHRALVVRRHAK